MQPLEPTLPLLHKTAAIAMIVFLGGLAPGKAAAPAEAPLVISAIEVSGNARVSTEAILGKLRFAAGQAYDAGQAERSLQALYATGLFRDVAMERRGAALAITVSENPTLASFAFSGNDNAGKTVLEPLVQLKASEPVTAAKARAAANRIRTHYLSLGRVATSVEPAFQTLPENRVSLTFRIHEAQVMKIEAIGFTGNASFPSDKLRAVIASEASGWADFIKKNVVFDQARLEVDRDLLVAHYLKNGFPDAQVFAPEARESGGHKAYQLTFAIEEGQRFTFAEPRIESAIAGLDTGKLMASVAVKPLTVYNATAIELSVQQLTAALVDAGYPSGRVRVQTSRNSASRTMALTFIAEEGPRITIKRIDIHGNGKTKDTVIRRELKLREGDILNQVTVDRDRARIARLPQFKSVTIRAKPGSGPGNVVLDVDVTEQDTTELSFGAGYSSSEGVLGDVSITDTNLFGNGQTGRLKLSGSATRFQADASFTEPHLFDSTYAGGFDFIYKDSDQTAQSSYKSLTIGGDVRVGTALGDNTTATVMYGLKRGEIYSVGTDASAAIKEATGTYYTSSVGTAVTYDTRNNRAIPTSGTYFTVGQDFAGIGGDAQYFRNTAEGRLYYPLSDKVTLVGRVAAGNVTGWGGQEVRLLDQFYKGGETVRGFAASGIGPRDLLSANQDALGGQNYITTTAEARFALPFLPDDVPLRGSVFADAGTLFGVNKTAAALPGLAGSKPAARVSVGTGLVWDSPLGPLGVSYATPLVKQPFDKTQPLSFGVMPF